MDFKYTEEKEMIKINNIMIHKYTVLYTSNCIMDIYSEEEKITCSSNRLVFLERGVNISVRIQKKILSERPYVAFRLNGDILRHLKNALMIIYGMSKIDINDCRNMSRKIIKTEVDKTLLDVLKNINSYDDSVFISSLIYLISKI